MKIIAFGASNSSKSINKKWATHVSNLFIDDEVEVLDLNDYQLPVYSTDIEINQGIPLPVHDFINAIANADLLIISLAEHNGTYTSAFKNLFDWSSRLKSKCFEGPKMLLLSTSPGARGGQGAMDAALIRFPLHGANIVSHFCLPKFGENFDSDDTIKDSNLKAEFEQKLTTVREAFGRG